MSILSHAYTIVIYCGVVSPGHIKDVVDGLNTTEKRFLTILMTTVQLDGESTNNAQMVMHTSIINTDKIEYKIKLHNMG